MCDNMYFTLKRRYVAFLFERMAFELEEFEYVRHFCHFLCPNYLQVIPSRSLEPAI